LFTARFNLRLIDIKILAVALTFSLWGGFYESAIQQVTLFLSKLGFSIVEIGATLTLWGWDMYLLITVLYFAMLYLACRRRFMENVASIILSLIVGSMFGRWIGGLLGFLFGFPTPPTVSSLSMFAGLLSPFGACSAAYVSERWKNLISSAVVNIERPFGVALIAILYVISGVSLFILVGVLFGFGAESIPTLFSNTVIIAGSLVLVAVTFVLYLFVAYGLYHGRLWAWLVTFTSTMIGVFSSLNGIILGLSFDIWIILKILGFVLGVVVIIYLLQPHVRVYFGIINPKPANIVRNNMDTQG